VPEYESESRIADTALRRRVTRALRGRAFPLVLLIASCTALDLSWLYRIRSGFPTEWDESGYIAIAVRNTHALQDGGLISFVRTVETQSVEAPLVPFLTVPLHLLLGTGVTQSLLVLPMFFAILVVATYGIARRLLPSRWALVAALVVAAVPDVTDHTRLYHFAVPAAALLTAATWALLQSERLSKTPFALAFGVLLGLTPLARTMTLAYLPALAIAAIVQVVATREERWRRVRNLVFAGAAALSVSALWYARNWGAVRAYLVGSGFGSPAALYGTRPPVLSTAFWTRDLLRVANELYLPLTAALVAAFVVAGVVAVTRLPPRHLRAALGSDVLVLILVVAEGYLAVSSTSNEGTSFELPWLPALVILAVAAAATTRIRSLRLALALVLSGTAVAAVAMKSGFFPELSAFRQVDVPGFGHVVVTDGRDVMERDVAAAGYVVGDGTKRLPSPYRGWPKFQRLVVERIAADSRRYRLEPHGVLASNSSILTNTSLSLAATLDRAPVVTGWLRPAPDSELAYSRELHETNAKFVLVAESPLVPQRGVTLARAVQAAISLGFQQVEVFTMPDGRKASLWWLLGRKPTETYLPVPNRRG
jgi:4-amino-4-deoxy-L-arabinose transferase-like glycosyltransferase